MHTAIRMVECPSGIHAESARKFGTVARSWVCGQEIIDKIREIDAAKDRLQEVKEVAVTSVNNCRLNLPIDSACVKDFALACLDVDRKGLVAKLNRLYSSEEG